MGNMKDIEKAILEEKAYLIEGEGKGSLLVSCSRKEYEEKYIDILSNSTSDDYVFFTDYLERNKERLDSINNF